MKQKESQKKSKQLSGPIDRLKIISLPNDAYQKNYLLNKNKNIYIAFIDLKAAFDQIPKSHVWKSLQEAGVNEQLIRNIESVYNNVTAQVRLNGELSSGFKMKKGLKQGDSLSPLLFVIVMDRVNCMRNFFRASFWLYSVEQWLLSSTYNFHVSRADSYENMANFKVIIRGILIDG